MRCEKCGSKKVKFKYSEEKQISDWSEEVKIVDFYRCIDCGHWMKMEDN